MAQPQVLELEKIPAKKVIKPKKPVEPKGPTNASIARIWRTYGFTPKFYSKEEITQFKDVFDAFGLDHRRLEANLDLLYQIFPRVDLKPTPDEYALTQSEKYGFKSFNLAQFFVRPNLRNVKSCHAVVRGYRGGGACNSGGNLGYLTNPCWGCIGLYAGTETLSSWGDQPPQSGYSASKLELPNILATCNVCIGYVGRSPAILFSRVYGSVEVWKKAFPKLYRHLKVSFGIPMYAHHKYRYYAGTAGDKDISAQFFTLPCEPQFTLGASMPHRYTDIESMRYRVVEGKKHILEYLNSYKIDDFGYFGTHEEAAKTLRELGIAITDYQKMQAEYSGWGAPPSNAGVCNYCARE
jgi:hypothetical protein